MSDHPILFSASMIRALLDGRKTQTRRALKPQPRPEVAKFVKVATDIKMGAPVFETRVHSGQPVAGMPVGPGPLDPQYQARHAVGDRLWVRETIDGTAGCDATYCADDGRLVDAIGWDWVHVDKRWLPGRVIPSIHSPRKAFQRLLESINGPGSWDENPWVVAYTFDVRRRNIDEVNHA